MNNGSFYTRLLELAKRQEDWNKPAKLTNELHEIGFYKDKHNYGDKLHTVRSNISFLKLLKEILDSAKT